MSKPADSTSSSTSDDAEQRGRRTRPPAATTGTTTADTVDTADTWSWRGRLAAFGGRGRAWLRRVWTAPRTRAFRRQVIGWQGEPRVGLTLLLLGSTLVTLLVLALDRLVVPVPNPGIVYLPLIAMLAYYWSWRLGAVASVVQLVCVYVLFLTPVDLLKPLSARGGVQLVTLAAVNVFTLLLVQLARAQRDTAARQANRSAALNEVGRALASELDEARLLRLIAQTARELTGAGFAAFTLRPLDAHGHPLVPAEGHYFHLAAVVGVTPEQEALFRRMPLGGEGLLAPIFRNGVPVRVADALAMAHVPLAASSAARPSDATVPSAAAPHAAGGHEARRSTEVHAGPAERAATGQHPRITRREAAREAATAYAHGQLAAEELYATGIPRGHPVVRSFLGVPLLDRDGQVRGGLLLGHTDPGRFTEEDEQLLSGLAAQAAVALENARLYRAAQTQAQELDAIFESISDAVMLVDGAGAIIRENRAASALRAEGEAATEAVERMARDTAAAADEDRGAPAAGAEAHAEVFLAEVAGEERQYAVTAAPLRDLVPGGQTLEAEPLQRAAAGAVVVWHDLTEARRLLRERQARAEADARRALLQLVIDQLPGGVYLVRGPHARLVLANQAARDVWGADWTEGQPMAEFLARRGVRILSPAGQPLAESELATVRAVRSGEAVRHHQEIIRRPDGTALPVLLNAVAVDSEVIPFGRASATPDEQETAQTGHTLTPVSTAAGLSGDEHERERSALVVLQDVTALKDAERVKDEFITIAAHELKTPMAAVKGYTDMLRRRSARGATNGGQTERQPQIDAANDIERAAALEPWQLDALETIDQAMGRLVELTEDLLDVARLQAGRVELHLEAHDLAALARRVTKRLQFSAERHTLTVESQAEYVVALLDVRRIEQVVGNLLSNAIKYSPEGGPITVAVRAVPERGEAVLTVRDRGIGVPADQQVRLFARFARADNARAAGIGGTGLGLYLSRELVERHGGRIWFESEEGAGSAFSIALPLAGEDEDDAGEIGAAD